MRVSYSEHPPLPRPGAAPTTFYYIIPTLPQAGEGFFTNKSTLFVVATAGQTMEAELEPCHTMYMDPVDHVTEVLSSGENRVPLVALK